MTRDESLHFIDMIHRDGKIRSKRTAFGLNYYLEAEIIDSNLANSDFR